MSAKMSEALYVTYAELAFLLGGSEIFGLRLPEGVSNALTGGADAARALASLAREKLLATDEPDGLLDYDPRLREMLRIMRDTRVSLVVRRTGERLVRIYHIADDGRCVLLASDSLRQGSLRLSFGLVEDMLGELVAELEGLSVLPVSQVLPWGGSEERMAADGLLLYGELSLRGDDSPIVQLRVMRLMGGNLIDSRRVDGQRYGPLSIDFLLEMLEEVSTP